MKQLLVNPVTIRPIEIKPGMVMAVTVTCYIIQGRDGLEYRLYRCPYPRPRTDRGIPQGDGIYVNQEAIVQALFPVVDWAGVVKDPYP